MRELWVKFKKIPSHLINFFNKYRTQINVGCLVFVVCGLFMLLREIEHGKQLIQMKKEKALILMHLEKTEQNSELKNILLKRVDSEMGELMDLATKQGMLLNEQGHELERVKGELYIKTLF